MWFSMISEMIKYDFILEGNGQIMSGSVFLPDPVALDSEEQRFEREQNERDALELLCGYKFDAGMSVESVNKFSTGGRWGW